MILVYLEAFVYSFSMRSLSPDIYEKMVAGKLFIDGHFDTPIQLEEIAQHVYVSPYHFHRLFTKVYRITPHQYITKKRVEKAKQLLKTGTVTLSGICAGIGFESYGSFSLLFKKHSGLPPKTYQAKAAVVREKAKQEPRFVIPSCFLASHDPSEK